MAFPNLVDSAIHRAELVISTKKSDYGDFKIAKLIFGFVVVEVTDRWITTLDDGKYLGDFEIQRIFNHTQTCKSTGFVKVSMRAVIGDYTLYKPDEIVPHLPNYPDQGCSDLTNQLTAYKAEVEKLKEQLRALSCEKEQKDSALSLTSERVTSLEVALADSEREKALLLSNEAELTSIVDKLKNDLCVTRRELEQSSSKVLNLTEDNTILCNQVDKLEKQQSETLLPQTQCDVKPPIQTDMIQAVSLSEGKQSKKETLKNTNSSSNVVRSVFGDFFGDIKSISDLPDEIHLKEIDEDIAANRALLTRITKLLSVKHGGDYTLSPKELIWRRV